MTCLVPTVLLATDSRVKQVGRFERNGVDLTCSWPGSALEVRFRGTSLNFELEEKGDNHYQVFVDGARASSFSIPKGKKSVTVFSGPNGEHSVRVAKMTEPLFGQVVFKNFSSDAPITFLPPKRVQRRMEFIGDSITCGFGNLSASIKDPFLSVTEDATQTYWYLAAEHFGADAVALAWSGRKMWPDNTIPEIYDRALPESSTSTWNFANQVPDVVLINLATNDFGQKNPDEKGWTSAYVKFIQRIRSNYPKAWIYCSIGSMMSDNWPPKNKALSTLRGYIDKIVTDCDARGDKRVGKLEFAIQDVEKDGGGAAYHPNVKTHTIMSKVLLERIRKDLGW